MTKIIGKVQDFIERFPLTGEYAGRIGRRDFFLGLIWTYVVPNIIASLVIAAFWLSTLILLRLFSLIFPKSGFSMVNASYFLIVPVAVALSIWMIYLWGGVVVRRFKDLGWSPVCCFLLVIPFVNLIVFGILLFKRGVNGENSYGPDPLK